MYEKKDTKRICRHKTRNHFCKILNRNEFRFEESRIQPEIQIFITFHHSIFPFLDAKFIYIFLYPKFIHPNYKDLSKCLPSVYLFQLWNNNRKQSEIRLQQKGFLINTINFTHLPANFWQYYSNNLYLLVQHLRLVA